MTDLGVPTLPLLDGRGIPQLGFGTFKIPPAETERAVLQALEAGYRHIDTAEMYGNEAEVGAALRSSGLDREEVFVTSKLNNGFHAYPDAVAAFDRTMADLGLDELDLFLIHWPMPEVGFVETWRAMVAIAATGRCRSIGVSNFNPHHVEEAVAATGVTPAVNQIEVHPYLAQDAVRADNRARGVVVEAWSPLAKGRAVADPVVRAVAAEVGRTPAQVVLRWHVQRGDVVIPKSVNPSRVAENAALFDFALTDAQMASITALDRGERTGPDPDTFNRIF